MWVTAASSDLMHNTPPQPPASGRSALTKSVVTRLLAAPGEIRILFHSLCHSRAQPSCRRSLSAVLRVQQLSCAGERKRKKKKKKNSASKTGYK